MARSWTIFHLKQNRIPTEDLISVYSSIIRFSIEYAVSVYHHMLNGEQTERLERMQRKTFKTIYGHKVSYRSALERSGLRTLAERREEIVETFTAKLAANGRFSEWFPLKPRCTYCLRKHQEYEELRAGTDQLMKSPLYSMRKNLNKK